MEIDQLCFMTFSKKMCKGQLHKEKGTFTVICPTSCKLFLSSEADMKAAGTEDGACLAAKGYLRPRLTQCVKVQSQSQPYGQQWQPSTQHLPYKVHILQNNQHRIALILHRIKTKNFQVTFQSKGHNIQSRYQGTNEDCQLTIS